MPPRLLSRRPAAAATALLAGLLLAACGRPDGDTSLFPLDGGHRWTYRVQTERDDDSREREQLELRSDGRADLDGRPTWLRRSSSGALYWLRSDASGIYRVASRHETEAEPEADPQPRYVLKAPFTPGTQWQATTTPYLLQRRNEFPREIRHSHPAVTMSYRIEATGQRVQTPAGDFDGCLRVQGTATVRLFADPTAGWKDLPLTTTEWYCPGVGLVKLERHEPAASAFLSGGRLTMELSAWQ